jgi:23S rRNA (guanine745-N1)-methyltransferase
VSIKLTSFWQCPACEAPLVRKQNQWCCANGHTFDKAKEGYVNLLLAQHKKSKVPGDNKDMVIARRAFLSEHHYLPLALHIAQLLSAEHIKHFSSQADYAVFDAGCGEGYYLHTIAKKLIDETPEDKSCSFHFCGIDIAKAAIQKAAKSTISQSLDNIDFAVASSFNLPLISQSQHAVIQVFAPSSSEEIHRVLANGGLWIKVAPGGDHLYELKSMVYDRPEKHPEVEEQISGFTLLSQQTIKFELELSSPASRQNLLMMTPFYWSISLEKKQKLLKELSKVHAHFDIKMFRKI